MKFEVILSFCLLFVGLHKVTLVDAQNKPNVIFILIDDMGYGDLSCNNTIYQTPNIDKIAKEGIRFTNFYSASPICSPSRTGFLTGLNPAKNYITNFLSEKKRNKQSEQNDFLNPNSQQIAKVLKNNGYSTAHFGKWHLGGGRDVSDAPSILNYGFDEYSSTWESPNPDPLLTAKNWIWSPEDSIKRYNRTAYFVDKTLEFLQKNKEKPCFVNLWPDDVHTPWVTNDLQKSKKDFETEHTFKVVLAELDKQIARLLDGLNKLGIADNTLVVFTSDNGPLPNFRQDRSAGLRGSKLSLYEAGIKMPLLIKWPNKIKAGQLDTTSVMIAQDLFPTICKLANIKTNLKFDGEDKSKVFLGEKSTRKTPIYWEYGRNDIAFKYPQEAYHKSPSLAMRDGKWKLLMDKEGKSQELYNLNEDKNETNNLLLKEIGISQTMTKKLLDWWKTLPKLE